MTTYEKISLLFQAISALSLSGILTYWLKYWLGSLRGFRIRFKIIERQKNEYALLEISIKNLNLTSTKTIKKLHIEGKYRNPDIGRNGIHPIILRIKNDNRIHPVPFDVPPRKTVKVDTQDTQICGGLLPDNEVKRKSYVLYISDEKDRLRKYKNIPTTL